MDNNSVFTEKLRSSGLRPTKQRIKICKLLFDRKKTFHFTINDLSKILRDKTNKKISLATIYNTVHSFKKKGYLKEVAIASDKSYFDTNISAHVHFYNEKNNELTDIDINDIELKKIPTPPKGKSIKDIDIVINIENDSH